MRDPGDIRAGAPAKAWRAFSASRMTPNLRPGARGRILSESASSRFVRLTSVSCSGGFASTRDAAAVGTRGFGRGVSGIAQRPWGLGLARVVGCFCLLRGTWLAWGSGDGGREGMLVQALGTVRGRAYFFPSFFCAFLRMWVPASEACRGRVRLI